MAAPFHRSEITAGNVTKQPVLAHEAIASFSGDQQLTIPVSSARVRPPRTAPACSAQRPPPPPHRSPLAPAHLNRRSLRFQPSPTTQPHGGSAGSAERSRTDPRERTGSSPATMPDTPPPRARGAVERPCGERCRSGGPSGPARRERSVSGTWNLGRGKRAWWAGDGHQRVVDQVAPDLGQVCGSSAEGRRTGTGPSFPCQSPRTSASDSMARKTGSISANDQPGLPMAAHWSWSYGHPRSAKQALVAGQPPVRRPRGSGTERPRSSSSETRTQL